VENWWEKDRKIGGKIHRKIGGKINGKLVGK